MLSICTVICVKMYFDLCYYFINVLNRSGLYIFSEIDKETLVLLSAVCAWKIFKQISTVSFNIIVYDTCILTFKRNAPPGFFLNIKKIIQYNVIKFEIMHIMYKETRKFVKY